MGLAVSSAVRESAVGTADAEIKVLSAETPELGEVLSFLCIVGQNTALPASSLPGTRPS